MKKPYCLKCEKRVNYEIKEETISTTIKGKVIEFKSKSAYCVNCGEYVFVEEIEDNNIVLARNIFSKEDK
jgi:YgiT-type zinc finger domain-containing protein